MPTDLAEGDTPAVPVTREADGSTIQTPTALRILAIRALPLLVALATAAVFASSVANGFVEWDDHVNFVDNPNFRGLAWKNIRWMLTTALMGQWIPLTWLTLGMDYALWGMNPLGYHLTSVLLHVLGALVFYTVARRLLAMATPWRGLSLAVSAGVAALFFSIHPLRVESVAWATERRDVLSGVWFLFTVLTYLKAGDSEARRRRWLVVSMSCFALAVLSKSMVVTLPAILLLLDVYPLRRLTGSPRDWLSDRHARQIWLEKVPYFALAALGAGMAFWAQSANSFLTPLSKLSIVDRLVVVLHSLWFYVATSALPCGLLPVYELPARINPLELRFIASTVGVVLLTAVFGLLRRRWPAGLTAWIAYAIMLSPVSGVFHNGHQLVHDRYSYLPCLVWALLVGGAVGTFLQAWGRGTIRPALARMAAGAGVLVLAGYAAMTIHQVGVWRDTDSLWRFAVESQPTCGICHNNLGVHLLRKGLATLAIPEFHKAVALRPDRVGTNASLGLAYIKARRPTEALEHFRKVLQRHPKNSDILSNVGAALLDQGRADEAMRELGEALRHDPKHVSANVNMGLALIDIQRPAEALPYLQRAFELQPTGPHSRVGLVRAWLALDRSDLALEQYEALRTLDAGAADYVAPLLMASW